MTYSIRHLLTQFGVATSHPIAFVVVLAYGGLWWLFDRHSLEWHGIATMATWLMTLLIQRAEHRDTQAIHAKLDELLKADGKARNELRTVDNKEPEEIEKHRQAQNR